MAEEQGDPLISGFQHAHLNSDTDLDVDSLHHTLGPGPQQAAPGNHSHTVTAAQINTDESTTFGILTDLATEGPSITVNVPKEGRLLVGVSAESLSTNAGTPVDNNTGLGVVLGGVNAGTFQVANFVVRGMAAGWSTLSTWFLFTNLVAGITSVKLQYRNAQGVNLTHFRNRRIYVSY